MPHVEATFADTRFEDGQFAGRMITALTEAVSSVLGEDVADSTTVILHGIDRTGRRDEQLSGQ